MRSWVLLRAATITRLNYADSSDISVSQVYQFYISVGESALRYENVSLRNTMQKICFG